MNAEERIKDVLNPEQWDAVRQNDSHSLILAGAGTGKTRVITHKVAYLVDVLGFKPFQIMAVTFTNKAAGEIKERVGRMLDSELDWPYFGTFHSQGLRMVRRHADLLGFENNLTICDDQDQQALVKRVMNELDIDPKHYPPRQAAGFIDRCKNRFQYPDDLPEEAWEDDRAVFAQIYRLYEKRLRAANGVDFGDLICLPVKLLREHAAVKSQYQFHLKHLLVDEFQDTNTAQYLWLKELGSAENLVTVVGDDDQSIYRWRGAEVGNILSFPKEFPGTRITKLEQNYRSTPNILEVAAAMISHNTKRHVKTLRPTREGGAKVGLVHTLNEHDEVRHVVGRLRRLRQEGLSLDEAAILYRTNAQSRVFEESLQRDQIAYRIYGGVRFYERAEIKDMLAYAKLVFNPRDDLSFLRVLNTPARGVGRVSVDKLVERAGVLGQPLAQAAKEALSDGVVRGKGAKGVTAFLKLIRDLRTELEGATASQVLDVVQLRTGYREALEEEHARGSLEAEARLENLQELVSAAAGFEKDHPEAGIGDFLDYIGLMTSMDAKREEQDGEVLSLMSVHNAKGLEFDTVFVTGVEEHYFPHFNSSDSPEEVEEERRLLYVAFTRARNRLFISHALTRSRYRGPEARAASRFLQELPESALDRGRGGKPSGARRRPTRRPDSGGMRFPVQDAAAKPIPADAKKVRHPAFGVGVIMAEEGRGPSHRYTVRFNNVGTVKLPARQVKLEE